MNITKNIMEILTDKNMSIAKLARDSKIPTVSLRVMLSRIDGNNWNVNALIKIAKVLNTSVAELCGGTSDKSRKEELISMLTYTVNNVFKNK